MEALDTKDVTIKDKTYQIKRMDSETGSWLLFKLIDSLRKILSDSDGQPEQPQKEPTAEEKEQAAMSLVQGMLMTLDRPLFNQVQREALKVCGQYAMVGEKEVVLPVILVSGRFATPELATDIPTVVKLTSQSLYFNLAPFFLGGGLNSVLG